MSECPLHQVQQLTVVMPGLTLCAGCALHCLPTSVNGGVFHLAGSEAPHSQAAAHGPSNRVLCTGSISFLRRHVLQLAQDTSNAHPCEMADVQSHVAALHTRLDGLRIHLVRALYSADSSPEPPWDPAATAIVSHAQRQKPLRPYAAMLQEFQAMTGMLQAEAFAALVQLQLIAVGGAVKTIVALLRKPDNRLAAITMLGKTSELCYDQVGRCHSETEENVMTEERKLR